MNRLFGMFAAGLIGLAVGSCTEKPQEIDDTPMIKMELGVCEESSISVSWKALDTDCVYLDISLGSEAPQASELIKNGFKTKGDSHTFTGLEPAVRYNIFAVPVNAKGVPGDVTALTAWTASDKYVWNKGTGKLPEIADMALCYGGSTHRIPYKWDKERFAPMVSYVTDDGVEHWLFESFLAIEFCETGRKMDYSPVSNNGRNSGDKESWTALLDYWFEEGYGLDALNDAVEDVKDRIGYPKTKRLVVMTLPEPIIYQDWPTTSSSTTYWDPSGQIDFATAEGRVKALKWFVDETHRRFEAKNYTNLELVGFYMISEDLSGTWNGKKFGWDPNLRKIDEYLPEVARYVHGFGEGMYWIPYFNAKGIPQAADPLFGFDWIVMQPNHYWDPSAHDMTQVKTLLDKYDMGMELEFDDFLLYGSYKYEDGKYVGRNDDAAIYRNNFRDYLNYAKNTGIYGQRPFALYEGGNGFYEIATTTDPECQAIFKDLCEFILYNPIKKY